MSFVILNGELVDKNLANISVYNKALFFDFAVYDSIKVIKGKSFFPKFHVDRLFDSATILGLEHSFTKAEVLLWIDMLINKNDIKDALIRFLLIGAGSPDEKPQLFLFPVGLTFYSSKEYNSGIKVITYDGERLIPRSKSKDLLLNFLAYREATKKDCHDALLVDSKGYVLEGTRTNFFAVKNNTLYTASSSKVLEGIIRKIILELAKENNIKVVEEEIHFDNLANYDEFFISSTSMNILPIRQIICTNEDINREIGPLTKYLIKLLREYYQKEVYEKE
jgi:branched-subunit amino acid aminotransferase/4-amino-4-deoxychorismate lyase